MDNKLISRVTQQLQQASNVSKTQAGDGIYVDDAPEKKEAINQIFELFRFNYHNQFLKAFPDLDTLIMAKRLWLRLLNEYSPEVIMRAGEKAVKESSWLPTVHDVVDRCDIADAMGLPSVHAAYMEACRAPSPKKEFAWSHPIVYYAGLASDWFFLANSAEQDAFPVFKRNYEVLLRRLQHGETIEMDIPKALPEQVDIVVPRDQARRFLSDLKSALR